MLHYTAPPVVGGVEAVIQAHARVFTQTGYPVTVIAGWGDQAAFHSNVDFIRIPQMDSRYEAVLEASAELAQGKVPPVFGELVSQLEGALETALNRFDNVIVHNIFTKHFNLPLTAALHQLLDAGMINSCIAWCHDFTWTSPSSRSKVHPGYPWDLLRTQRSDMVYVVVSQHRQRVLAELLDCPKEQIHVVYNGVDPTQLLGLSEEGFALVKRLGVLERDLVLLMPVRVTRAKNIEFAMHVVAELKSRDSHPKLVVTGPPDPHDAASMAYFRTLLELRHKLGVETEVSFVYESGPDPSQPFTINEREVGDLFRTSDVMFMPSHREGFGMPVLEAGLVGIPAIATDVPAADEIGSGEVIQFRSDDPPASIAERIMSWAERSPVHRLRRRVRQRYTWQAIFHRDIEPLLRRDQAS
jgi:glycosyltransferase involved in cell wall biosynthesis